MGKLHIPFVAICVPAYEKLELLKRLELSILKQTYKNYIVIITDDSYSKEIEQYMDISELRNLEGFVYIHNDYQMGPCANTNKCMRIGMEMGASFIKVMHQDDYFAYKYSLEKIVQKIEKDKTDVVFVGDYEDYGEEKRKRICNKDSISIVRKDLTFLYRSNILGAPSVMMFRARDIQFDVSFQWLLDVDFYLRLLDAHSFSYIYQPLICIGHDGEQLTDFCLAHPNIVMQETMALYCKYRCLHTIENKIYLLRCLLHYLKLKIKKIIVFDRGDNNIQN